MLKLKTIVALCAICFAFGNAATLGAPRFTRNSEGRNNPGQEATDFELRTIDGGTFKLHDEKGKLVVLQFGATW